MSIRELLVDAWNMLIGRVQGPMAFRLVMQPLVASFFALRAGLKDARESRVPYVWAAFSNPAYRRDLFHEGWKDVRKVFAMAVILDVVYEIIEFRWVYPGQAVIVATILAIVPYVLVRGPVNRLLSKTPKLSGAKPAKSDGEV